MKLQHRALFTVTVMSTARLWGTLGARLEGEGQRTELLSGVCTATCGPSYLPTHAHTRMNTLSGVHAHTNRGAHTGFPGPWGLLKPTRTSPTTKPCLSSFRCLSHPCTRPCLSMPTPMPSVALLLDGQLLWPLPGAPVTHSPLAGVNGHMVRPLSCSKPPQGF